MESGGRSRSGHSLSDNELESFFQQFEALKEEYDAVMKRYADLKAAHTGNMHKLELTQEELSRVKTLYDEASKAVQDYQQQCTAAIRSWDAALKERHEYKEALTKVQQQHEEAMKEINQAMASRIKAKQEMKRLTEERDAALQEYSLIMSERDSVHRELEKLTDDLGSSKKQVKSLETANKELQDKLTEALKEADVTRRWALTATSEKDRYARERDSLKILCDRLRKEKDRAVSDLAEALSESEDIKKQKNLASKQLKELRDKMELEKENQHSMRMQYFSNSSSFSESRDSAIDSDMHSGHYSIKLPNMRGMDHGLVLEPGVYISRILPGSPASKDGILNVGDRVLYINDAAIDNVQDAIIALSEDIDPMVLTLSRSSGQLSSPITSMTVTRNKGNPAHFAKASTHASSSSLRSDKSDPNSVLSDGRRNGSNKGSGGLRDIFRRLPRKKHSSPEEEILATLDTAIATGGSAGASGGGSGTSRKNRKKRVSRNSGNEINKNGTWPRVIMSRNSYTLPQERGQNDATNHPSSSGNHHRESSYYGQYMPVGPGSSTVASNTLCVRRPNSSKDRAPLSSMLWDLQAPNPAKSVGAIASSGGGNYGTTGVGYGYAGKSSTLAGYGRPLSTVGGLALDNHGLPAPTSVQHHRYSMGVFDPSPNSSKLGKLMPERNSVVPTLTMSDGSSIDFSVKSGNTEILEYYVKRMVKNQNNSSESDHLDKVVNLPSMALANSATKSNTMSNLVVGHHPGPSNMSMGTLDRFPNRFSSPYPGHYHELLGGSGPLSSSNSGTMPLSLPKYTSNHYAFEPTSHYAHIHGGNESSMSMSHGGSSSSGHRLNLRNSDDLLQSSSYHFEPSGTFPRKKEPHRIRMSSNQSVTSRSSTEKVDMRNSPMPAYHVEVLHPVEGNPSRLSNYGYYSRKPAPGEMRVVRIDKYDKSTELGIQISCKPNGGGVFVSHVTEHSLASKAGLQVGDQLLEVCGINMRTATYDLAAKVLREAADSFSLLVQYSPEKSFSHGGDGHASSSEESDGESSSSGHNSSSTDNDSRSGSRSGSPTPCNSPQSTLVRNSKRNSSVQHRQGLPSGPANSSMSKKSGHNSANNSLTKSKGSSRQSQQSQSGLRQMQQQQIQQAFVLASQERERDRDRDPPSEQSTLRSTRSSAGASSVVATDVGDGKMLLQDKTRFLTLQLMKNSSNLGISMVGGNLVGIFIHSVQPDSVADRAGLRTGDQILEYNGTDLRHATAEEAAFELAKPLDKVGILVQYNLQRYNEICNKPGDGFYIRALFDYPALSSDHHHQGNVDPEQLTFLKDEILYVDNTMYNSKPGRWRAWKVDAEGRTRVCGLIPSKYKVEENMLFKRSLGDSDGDRRSSTVTRRSFFKRKSHHRSSSRELASFSDFSINAFGWDVTGQPGPPMKDENVLPLNSYQRVERLDHMSYLRPVIIVGALSDLIAKALVQEYPYQFEKVIPKIVPYDLLQENLSSNTFVDYKRKGSNYEYVTMAAILSVRERSRYCIMDISTSGVERLIQAQMYPIVLLVKFKNSKQIREIKDERCEKISHKAAKEYYEHSAKVENEYKHLITTCIHGGTNISYLATQAKTAVEKEQSKTLWVPA